MRRRTRILTACAAAGLALSGLAAVTTSAYADNASGLAACKHFSNDIPPVRVVGPSHPAGSTAPQISLAGRLAAPASIHGSFAAGKVTIGFNRVPGAKAYRVWRNAQSVAWISDWGQASLSAVDSAPCRNGKYTVVAMANELGADSSYGQLSGAYRLEDSGSLASYRIPAGTTYSFTISSYNDPGQTASGYTAGLGKCAVDTRVIPWGTRFYVDGYGYCYAADIGTWIQGNIVDIWLPGSQADNWGMQKRTITIK
jgi:3D (Asp-Asp-Asp) domain-containing protein